MKRTVLSRLAIGGAVAAMALGAVGCEDVEGNGDTIDPGMEEGGDDLGGDAGGDDL